jgi:hypothetical protein
MVNEYLVSSWFDSLGSLTKLQILYDFTLGWKPDKKDRLIEIYNFNGLKGKFGKKFVDNAEKIYIKWEKLRTK